MRNLGTPTYLNSSSGLPPSFLKRDWRLKSLDCKKNHSTTVSIKNVYNMNWQTDKHSHAVIKAFFLRIWNALKTSKHFFFKERLIINITLLQTYTLFSLKSIKSISSKKKNIIKKDFTEKNLIDKMSTKFHR